MCFKDSDVSNPREVDALAEFLSMDEFGIHNMRDSPFHWHPIMGGLWAAKLHMPLIRENLKQSLTNMIQDQEISFEFKMMKGTVLFNMSCIFQLIDF